MNLYKRIKRKLIDFGFYKIGKGKLCIATYHGVDAVQESKFNSRFFSATNLESHFKFFKRHFNSVSLEDIEQGNFDKEKINIHITFDDGYLNNYKYALPLIEKYQLFSTLYVTGMHTTENKILWADLLDISSCYNVNELRIGDEIFKKENGKFPALNKRIKFDAKGGFEFKSLVEKYVFKSLDNDFRNDRKFDDYWKLMNNNQIKEVSQTKYAAIGSHGFYHNNLGNLPVDIAVKEVLDSKKLIESLTQKEVKSIAFPDGSYSNALLKELKKCGFKTQFLFGAQDQEYHNIDGVYDREGLYPNASSENEIFYKLINGKTNRRI